MTNIEKTLFEATDEAFSIYVTYTRLHDEVAAAGQTFLRHEEEKAAKERFMALYSVIVNADAEERYCAFKQEEAKNLND